MKGIFSGRQIRDLKGRGQKITRSQTAAQAYNAVVQKYGELQDSARYFHKGNGVWQKYSIENDSRRTGRIAPSRSAWEEQPQRLDWWGMDTKGDKPKRKFSVGQIKAQAKISNRKSKVLPKFSKTAVVKKLEKPVQLTKRLQHTDRPLSSVKEPNGYWILKRTFEALKYPKSSEKRKELNRDVRTSEYNKDYKFRVMKGNTFIEEYKTIESAKKAVAFFIRYGDGITEHKHFMPSVSVRQLKAQAKLSTRKSKSLPKIRKELTIKKIKKPSKRSIAVGTNINTEANSQNRRLELLLNMEYVAPTNDPLNKYAKYERELQKTFPNKKAYKEWREKNLKMIEDRGLLQKFKNFNTSKEVQRKGKVTVVEPEVMRSPAVVKVPKTLKEINIRLNELRPILKPFYESTRKPTPSEAAAVKEANDLVKKRDGIVARSAIAYKKKEIAAETTAYTDKSVQGYPQKASYYNGLITVNSYIGRKLASSYNLSVDTWLKIARSENSANKVDFINRVFRSNSGESESQRQKIVASQIIALDHLTKMLK